jgi:asparagine synthase (glutamine-hydrolysing)
MTRAATLPTVERYTRWVAYFNEDERAELYTPEFRASLGEPFARTVLREPYLDSDAADLVNRLLDLDSQTYLPGDLLVKMDIASMAHSLEVRSPLLDHHFMEVAAGFPGQWKLHGRTRKKLFKDALREWIPGEILDREKQGFAVPLATWLRGELKELPSEILLDRRSLDRGLFREERLRRIIDDHVRGVRNHANQIWALIQLELWLQTFVDRKADGPLALSVAQAA